jgi:ketosteroid isomerase-like protein
MKRSSTTRKRARNNTVQARQIVRAFLAAFANGDDRKVQSLFAERGKVEIKGLRRRPLGITLSGNRAIKYFRHEAEVRRKRVKRCQVRISKITASNNTVAAEYSASVDMGKRTFRTLHVNFFEIRRGKIKTLRAYGINSYWPLPLNDYIF